jgi:hypothetical protein
MNQVQRTKLQHSEPEEISITIGSKSLEHYNRHRSVLDDEDSYGGEPAPRWETEDDEDIQENEGAAIFDSGPEAFKRDGTFIISDETVRQYALTYKGGHTAFERDVQLQWIKPVQTLSSDNKKWNSQRHMDVFTHFAHVTIEEFTLVSQLPVTEQKEYFTEHGIEESDFSAWVQFLALWEDSEAVAFSEQTLFGDVVRGTFAATLEKEKIAR